MMRGSRPAPEQPIGDGHERDRWFLSADIEDITLTQFIERMRQQYSDWNEFEEWMGVRDEHIHR